MSNYEKLKIRYTDISYFTDYITLKDFIKNTDNVCENIAFYKVIETTNQIACIKEDYNIFFKYFISENNRAEKDNIKKEQKKIYNSEYIDNIIERKKLDIIKKNSEYRNSEKASISNEERLVHDFLVKENKGEI